MDKLDWNIPDFRREKPRRFWDPGRRLLKSVRKYQNIKSSRNTMMHILKYYYVLQHRFWSVITGAEIDLTTSIGGGLLIPHPNGIVIHPNAVIGVNCLIFQQVTLAGDVVMGNHVDVGAGAKLLGPVTICSNVFIGANAVVTRDIDEPGTYVGIPAKKLESKNK